MSVCWIILTLGIVTGDASPAWNEAGVKQREDSPGSALITAVGMQEEVPLPDIMKNWQDRNTQQKQYEEQLARDIQDLREIEKFLSVSNSVRENAESVAAGGLGGEEEEKEEEESASQSPPSSNQKQAVVQVKKTSEQREAAVFGPFAAGVELNAASAQVQKMGVGSDVSNAASPMIIGIVAACSVVAVAGMVVAAVCVYRLKKRVTETSEAEYPAYGVTGPSKERAESPGDRKLAQSAQMYHYQHQKQQMIMMERANPDMKQEGSDYDSEDEGEEGDYTVYECPGLAPTGEMEVQNPIFNEESAVHTGSSSDGSADDEHK